MVQQTRTGITTTNTINHRVLDVASEKPIFFTSQIVPLRCPFFPSSMTLDSNSYGRSQANLCFLIEHATTMVARRQSIQFHILLQYVEEVGPFCIFHYFYGEDTLIIKGGGRGSGGGEMCDGSLPFVFWYTSSNIDQYTIHGLILTWPLEVRQIIGLLQKAFEHHLLSKQGSATTCYDI